MPSAVKLSDELVQAARGECRIWSRSMTQQIEHWARIGRAIERSGAVSRERVRAALAAELAFDELGTEERAVALGQLEREVFRPRGDAELAAELAEGSRPRSGVDAEGRLVVWDEEGRSRPIDDLGAHVAEQRGEADRR